MDYNQYSIEELAADESFQDYVIKGINRGFWEAWIQKNPDKRKYVEQAQQLVNVIHVVCNEGQSNVPTGQPQLIRSRLHQHITANPTGKAIQLKKLYPLLRVAASITLIFLVGWGTWPYLQPEKETLQPSIAIETWIEKTAPLGQKLSFKLPDGTWVKLNAESTLRINKQFQDKREVYLEGEAFFDVTRDSLHPFIIHTKNIITRVLGTSFNVRAYAEESSIAVAVVSGKVRVDQDLNSNDGVVLNPEEMTVYTEKDKEFSTQPYNPSKVLAWKEGVLYLENDTLKQVIKKLQRWYGVKIQVEKNYKGNARYTGSFSNESLENVLEALKIIGQFSYEIKEKQVTISSIN